MRSKRRIPSTPVEIPSYFPQSRYVAAAGEDLVIDHGNKKIVALPTVKEVATSVVNPINHVAIRSVKDQLLNKAENALLGTQSQTSNDSGVHPGILYGGPAGGVLAPIGVYFYRFFKRKWRRKKQRKKKKAEESDEESEEENGEETVRGTITAAISSRITNASTSVVNHIKGKFIATGSSLVDDLKAQTATQEEEILENIKTTILKQEEEMMEDIKEKFAKTQNTLIQDIKSKFSIFEKSRTAFEEKRKEEETLIKLSDSEEELTNTVKRRISNAQDALIPDMEKSIEATNENIIKNVQGKMPELRGHTWNTFKARMKKRSGSLFNEIKSILTCTENKIIDDVKSHIEEVKDDKLVEQKSIASDEIKVEIVQPTVNHKEIKVQIDNYETNENMKYSLDGEISHETIEKAPNLWNQSEKSYATPGEETNEIEKGEITDEIIGETQNIEENVKMRVESEFKHNESCDPVLSKTSSEAKESSENLSTLTKLKHKLIEIPGHFLKHPIAQTETKKDEIHLNIENDKKVSEETIQRTSPIPIPCKHRYKLEHFSTTEESVSDENLQGSNCKDSSSDETKDSSFFDRMKSSVGTHLPFNFNFSGIPEKVKSFIEPRKIDGNIETELVEVKVAEEKEATRIGKPSSTLDEENQMTFEEEEEEKENRENLLGLIEKEEHPPYRRWIVLEYDNEDSPDHSLKRKDSKEPHDETKHSKVRWLEFVEEDDTPWPSHLPKNLHGVNSKNIDREDKMKGESSRHHMRKKRNKIQNEDSESQEENDESHSNHKHLLNPHKTEDDRKESIVSSTSEFSTTSSVDFTSSGTLESRDSSESSKLPNFENKSKKKQRNARLKSLDSGIHHYYGEYIAIEFPISGSDGRKFDRDDVDMDRANSTEKEGTSNGSEGGSSENSQEDVKSVISAAGSNKAEEVENDGAQSSNKEAEFSEEAGGCYEGIVVSLQNSKRSA